MAVSAMGAPTRGLCPTGGGRGRCCGNQLLPKWGPVAMAMWCPRRKGGGGCHGNGCPAWGCWGGMGGDSDGDMAPALPVLRSTLRVTQGPSALLPEGPLSPQPHPAPSNWPWGGERSHSSPQWPLGPHHMFRNLRDTGAQAGMRRRDTVPELSTVAEDPKPGLRLAEPGDFRGVEPGPCA